MELEARRDLAGVKVNLIEHSDEIADFKRWLGERHAGNAVALDLETSGLSPYDKGARIRLAQLGDAMTGWAIPWDLWPGLVIEALNEYDGPLILHNCFVGDTKIITPTGPQTLRSLVGGQAEVWTVEGWRKADIQAFGRQPVQRVTFAPKGRRTNATQTVTATPDHRWILADGSETTDLAVGDVVMMAAPAYEVDPQSEGFRHGLIFGDGTLLRKGKQRSDGMFTHQLRLCGAKSQFSSSFSNVTYPSTYEGDPQAYHAAAYSMKSLPDTDDPEYLFNFIAGWAATDGSHNSTTTTRQITTIVEEHASWLRTYAGSCGYILLGHSAGNTLSGYTEKDIMTYAVTVGVPSAFYQKRFAGWTVKSIEPAGRAQVYCAVVPDVHAFTLDGGIYTGNCSFDIKWLEEHSPWRANWSRVRDTMIAARLVNPLFPAGLKPQSDRFIDRRASVGQKLLDEAFAKHGWTWDTVPVNFEPYWSYGALDTVLTVRLDEMYQPAVGVGAPYAEAFDLEMATVRITTRMEQKGALIDRDYCTEMYDKCTDYELAIKQWARENFGGIEIGSPARLARKFSDLGAEISVFTEKGHPKVDKWQLKIFADPDNGYPVPAQKLAEQVLLQRKYGKLASSYFGNFISQNKDGIIHASINPMAARTGRMSISNPALQQLPRGDAMVRDAFLAREGNVLLSTDFSQIEMRMMAVFSNDPELQHAFAEADETGGDFFVTVGREVYREPGFAKGDKRRNLIKSTMYGMAYGAGVAKMAETAGVPVERMKDVSDALTARYPGIKNFMRQVEDVGKRREFAEGEGYVNGIDGRRLPCDTGRVYTLVNYLIQGGAAVIYKRALSRLDAAGYGDTFIIPVHDEIVMDIPKEDAPDAMVDVPRIMQDNSMAVAVPADMEGPFDRWGSKYRGK